MLPETVFSWFPRGLVPKLYIIDRSAGIAITGYVAAVHESLDRALTINPAAIFRYRTSSPLDSKYTRVEEHTLWFPFRDVDPEEDGAGSIDYGFIEITSSIRAHVKRMAKKAEVDAQSKQLWEKYLAFGAQLSEPAAEPYQTAFPGAKPVRKRFLVPREEPFHFTPTIEHLLEVRELHKLS